MLPLEIVYHKDISNRIIVNFYYGYISLAERDYQIQTHCNLYDISHGLSLWNFTNYDLVRGYPPNQHCYNIINKTTDNNFAFWLDKYSYESAFDNVTSEVSLKSGITLIQRDKVYLSPPANLYLRFDSDGSIQEAGFSLIVYQFGKAHKF